MTQKNIVSLQKVLPQKWWENVHILLLHPSIFFHSSRVGAAAQAETSRPPSPISTFPSSSVGPPHSRGAQVAS